MRIKRWRSAVITVACASALCHARLVGAQALESPTIRLDQSGECGQTRSLVVSADIADGIAQAATRVDFNIRTSIAVLRDGVQIRLLEQNTAPANPFGVRLDVPRDLGGTVDLTLTLTLELVDHRGGTHQLIETRTLTVHGMDIGSDPMFAIYGDVRIDSLMANPVAYAPGERPHGKHVLVNQSDRNLCIPQDPIYPAFHTVGILQAWIERLGEYKEIPGIPPFIARDAAGRYAAGGQVIVTDYFLPTHQWPATMSQPYDWGYYYDTSLFPSGQYRYYLEYKKRFADGGEVIQTVSVDFQVN